MQPAVNRHKIRSPSISARHPVKPKVLVSSLHLLKYQNVYHAKYQGWQTADYTL